MWVLQLEFRIIFDLSMKAHELQMAKLGDMLWGKCMEYYILHPRIVANKSLQINWCQLADCRWRAGCETWRAEAIYFSYEFCLIGKLNPSDKLQWSLYYYSNFIMSAMASQITGVSIVYSTNCSGVSQRKHQSSTSLACVRGIHRWPVTTEDQKRGKCFHVMTPSCLNPAYWDSLNVSPRYNDALLITIISKTLSVGDVSTKIKRWLI